MKITGSSVLMVLYLVLCSASQDKSADTVSVRISQGDLAGKELKTVNLGRRFYSFQGVPYAEPPVRELRFMPPKQFKRWEGTFLATNDTKKCPQKDIIFDRNPQGDEDCLVLNVYTPALQKDVKDVKDNKSAVMFWIHGGGFSTGSGGTDFFGPDYFMEENVVLVTTNYRLGPLGFLNLEDENVSGNMGLKDIVMALKWVQENIYAFNGDKKNVTIFGNNAGGAAVSLLLHSPMAKGLFSKAICQSGVARLPQLFPSNDRQRAFTLAKLLRKDPSDSASLLRLFQKLTSYEFIDAAPKTYDSTEVRNEQKGILPFGPSVEKVTNKSDAFLAENPDELLKDVNVLPDPNIPLMMGFNSKEGILFMRNMINSPEILEKLNYNFQFSVPMRGLKFQYNSESYKAVASDIKRFYFKDGVIRNSSMNEYVDYVSDGVLYPVEKTLSDYLKMSKAPIFYYRFSFDGSLNFFKRTVLSDMYSIRGASSGDEICYLFRCSILASTYQTIQASEAEEMGVIRKMVRMWTNFAKFGNPTPSDDAILDGLNWMPAEPGKHNFLDIDKSFTMGVNPGSSNVAFWDDIYSRYTRQEVNLPAAHVEL